MHVACARAVHKLQSHSNARCLHKSCSQTAINFQRMSPARERLNSLHASSTPGRNHIVTQSKQGGERQIKTGVAQLHIQISDKVRATTDKHNRGTKPFEGWSCCSMGQGASQKARLILGNDCSLRWSNTIVNLMVEIKGAVLKQQSSSRWD